MNFNDFVTGLPDKIKKLLAVATTDIEMAQFTLHRLEDTLGKALKIQEQINSYKSSKNYIPMEDIRRAITQSIEKIEEATMILKRIEELKNEPGYLSEKDIEDLSSSLDLFKHEILLWFAKKNKHVNSKNCYFVAECVSCTFKIVL